MTPKEIRQAQHAASVRMGKFDRLPRDVRDVLNYGRNNVRIPAGSLSLKKAQSLANGKHRTDIKRTRYTFNWT